MNIKELALDLMSEVRSHIIGDDAQIVEFATRLFAAKDVENKELRAALVEAVNVLEDANKQCVSEWPALYSAITRCNEVLK